MRRAVDFPCSKHEIQLFPFSHRSVQATRMSISLRPAVEQAASYADPALVVEFRRLRPRSGRGAFHA